MDELWKTLMNRWGWKSEGAFMKTLTIRIAESARSLSFGNPGDTLSWSHSRKRWVQLWLALENLCILTMAMVEPPAYAR